MPLADTSRQVSKLMLGKVLVIGRYNHGKFRSPSEEGTDAEGTPGSCRRHEIIPVKLKVLFEAEEFEVESV